MILEDMGRQQDNKAEQLRVGILTSLEMADVRDMLPLAEKLAEYRSAADYINELRRNPVSTVNDNVARELFFSATSHKHFIVLSTTRRLLPRYSNGSAVAGFTIG